MGANAVRHTMEIIRNVRDILAIELLAAAQGVDLRTDGPAKLGIGTDKAYRRIRRQIRYLEHDRPLSDDIHALSRMLADREFK